MKLKKILLIAAASVLAMQATISVAAAAPSTIDILKFDKAPVIDGKITPEEWGTATLKGLKSGSESTFESADRTVTGLTFDAWYRWDDTNYYIAIQTPDKVPFNQNVDGGIWNGDAIQFGFDPAGSTAMQSLDVGSPWGPDYSNLGFALINDPKGAVSFDYKNAGEVLDTKYSVVNDGTTTTYEIAIPWTTLFFNGGKPEVGGKYGSIMVLLNATDGEYDGWLTWGDGLCGPVDEDKKVGSNVIVLSDKKAIEVAPETTAAPVPETTAAPAPEATPTPETVAPVAEATPAPAPAAPQTSDFVVVPVITLAAAAIAGLLAKKKKNN